MKIDLDKFLNSRPAVYFYGIEPIVFISHGSWSDPEVSYNGITYNYYDLEDLLWSDFAETHDTDRYDPAFTEWIRDNEDLVFGYLSDLEANWYEQKKLEIEETAFGWVVFHTGISRSEAVRNNAVTYPAMVLDAEEINGHTVSVIFDYEDIQNIEVNWFVDEKSVHMETFSADGLIAWLKENDYGDIFGCFDVLEEDKKYV